MRIFNVKVNGQAYEVEVEEISVSGSQTTAVKPNPTTAPVAKVAPTVAPASAAAPIGKGTQLKCPLPGTIVDFKVENGAKVKKGQAVLIIEAMKMENEIASPADGVISFATSKGASVDSGDILAVIA